MLLFWGPGRPGDARALTPTTTRHSVHRVSMAQSRWRCKRWRGPSRSHGRPSTPSIWCPWLRVMPSQCTRRCERYGWITAAISSTALVPGLRGPGLRGLHGAGRPSCSTPGGVRCDSARRGSNSSTRRLIYERSNRPTAANRAEETLRATPGAFVVAEWTAAPLKTDQALVRNARV